MKTHSLHNLCSTMASGYIPTLFKGCICFMIIFKVSCTKIKPGTTTYDSIDVKNSDQQRVVKMDSLGNKLVEGLLWQHKRNGSWVTYFHSGQIETITNYIEDKKNGVYVRFGNDNKIAEYGSYKDDLFDGVFIRYLHGVKDEQLEFRAGKKNGWARKYYLGGGIQRELEFKDDEQHGIYRFYGEDGVKMIEETYKNGKKISGGIVSKQ